jgi:hypothetical protein
MQRAACAPRVPQTEHKLKVLEVAKLWQTGLTKVGGTWVPYGLTNNEADKRRGKTPEGHHVEGAHRAPDPKVPGDKGDHLYVVPHCLQARLVLRCVWAWSREEARVTLLTLLPTNIAAAVGCLSRRPDTRALLHAVLHARTHRHALVASLSPLLAHWLTISQHDHGHRGNPGGAARTR